MTRLAPFLLLMALGCGRDAPPRMTVVPAEFKVFHNNRPAVGAQVILVPVGADPGDAVMPRGQVGADGAVRLATYPDTSAAPDGAPPGEYQVSVRWAGIGPADSGRNAQPPGGVQGDVLRDRYSNPKTSGLRVRVTADGTTEPTALHLK